MPFTNNRAFKADSAALRPGQGHVLLHPRWPPGARRTAGLWCVNAGHGRAPIVEAIRRQAGELDFAPTFQLGHPLAFELAAAPGGAAPPGLDRVFFCNSGSEAVDSALKIALAYQRAVGRGERAPASSAASAAITASASAACRSAAWWATGAGSARCCRASIICGTPTAPARPFTSGQPRTGAELADDLERLVGLHGAETIAAVIVEPVAGSTGVLVPPKSAISSACARSPRGTASC